MNTILRRFILTTKEMWPKLDFHGYLGTVKYKRKDNTSILYQRIKRFEQICGQYNTNITKTTNRLHRTG